MHFTSVILGNVHSGLHKGPQRWRRLSGAGMAVEPSRRRRRTDEVRRKPICCRSMISRLVQGEGGHKSVFERLKSIPRR